MKDQRHDELAKLLVEYSIRLQAGERCLIQSVDVPVEMVEALIRAVYAVGGHPIVNMTSERVQRALAAGASAESIASLAETESDRMKKMDAYIGIRASWNELEMGDIGADQRSLYRTDYVQPVHFGIRVPHTKWVVLRYPTPTMAYQAAMSTEAFEDFYYRVSVGVDYAAMSRAMDRAADFISQAKSVHITGPGTDLRFSIEGLPAVKCDGSANIPDGEVYTCPVRESVEGTILYNTPSTLDGFTYRDISFRFEKGRIIEAKANDSERINQVLDTDEGARYIGEFSFGCNPWIESPMDNTLFDEKIAGSFHFTPGNAYDDCDNGNRSAVHWDLVCIQRPEWGGGEISIDGELVRKDGRFVHEAFQALNPDRLK
ncbi:aminopeptidase [Sediminispirochaeta bajacaliforniensis]|uniref:aminopeptidase n=1 Tax=Sediminispirochaeta bajacaliforniensis TaxID=148 RepID=UPI00037C3022|nr:aminopeptidase [Sediminispirochaeta bajacaliforniensis]